MLKRWTKKLLKVLLALLVLIFVFLLFERVRGQISLARYKHELIAKGEKLTFQELIPPVAQDENGAPEVFEAIERLKEGPVLPGSYLPMMTLTPAGRAVAGFRESEWVNYKQETNRWDQVAADLNVNETTLAQIRLALEKPVLNNKLDYSQGFKMRFDHLAPAKRLTSWFDAGSQLALHENKPREAVENLVAAIRLPRLLVEDHIVISELVRIAIAAIAMNSTWEALQVEGLMDDDFASLKTAWESQDFAVAMTRSLEGERIFGDVSFELVRKSNEDAIGALFGLEDVFPVDDSERPAWERFTRMLPCGEEVADLLKKQVYCRLWRFAWSHQNQRRGLETMQRLIEAARTIATEKSDASVRDAINRLQEEAYDRNLYDRLIQ